VKQTATSERARFVATCAKTIEDAKARALEYGIGAWFDDYRLSGRPKKGENRMAERF